MIYLKLNFTRKMIKFIKKNNNTSISIKNKTKSLNILSIILYKRTGARIFLQKLEYLFGIG